MTKTQLFKKIKLYQKDIHSHPLTCGNNSMHENLIPKIMGDDVILLCTECDYIQTHIPDFLFK